MSESFQRKSSISSSQDIPVNQQSISLSSDTPKLDPSSKERLSGMHTERFDPILEHKTGSFKTPSQQSPHLPTRVNKTPLELHVEFFDRDKDGIIMPWETFEGFRAVGFNIIMSFIGTFLTHVFMSYPTQNSWIPDLTFPIYIKNIRRARHGSDSRIYDEKGNFNQNIFFQVFSQYDQNNVLGFWDGFNMTEKFRNIFDLFGWFADKIEWIFMFVLMNGQVTKDDVLKMYDGTLFYELEARNQRNTQ